MMQVEVMMNELSKGAKALSSTYMTPLGRTVSTVGSGLVRVEGMEPGDRIVAVIERTATSRRLLRPDAWHSLSTS